MKYFINYFAESARLFVSQDLFTMSDSSTSSIRMCSRGCKSRLIKLCYDPHTVCVGCRGQECNPSSLCDECRTWDKKQWDIYLSHRQKLEKNRLRKAEQRAIKKVVASQPNLDTASCSKDLSPSPPLTPVSPTEPAPLPSGSLASEPITVSAMQDKFNARFDYVINALSGMGENLQSVCDRVFRSDSVEGVGSRPVDSPRSRSLSRSPVHGRRHTEDRTEVDRSCPRVPASSAPPVASSQVSAIDHGKGRSEVSSSESPDRRIRRRKRYAEESRPLKRRSEESGAIPEKRARRVSTPVLPAKRRTHFLSPDSSPGTSRLRAPVHQRLSPSRSSVDSPIRRSTAAVRDSSADITSRLDAILAKLNVQLPVPLASSIPADIPPPSETCLSPISSNSDDEQGPDRSPSAYMSLLRFLLLEFPTYFSPASPSSPTSAFSIANQAESKDRLPKMVLSVSARRAIKEMSDWLSKKRELGKSAFACPPSRLTKRRYSSYATGDLPSLGVAASSQGDFSSLVDSTRRSAFSSAKIMFTGSELDHTVKSTFKALEVISF